MHVEEEGGWAQVREQERTQVRQFLTRLFFFLEPVVCFRTRGQGSVFWSADGKNEERGRESRKMLFRFKKCSIELREKQSQEI